MQVTLLASAGMLLTSRVLHLINKKQSQKQARVYIAPRKAA